MISKDWKQFLNVLIPENLILFSTFNTTKTMIFLWAKSLNEVIIALALYFLFFSFLY